ncbi:MAG: MFS transporter [Burkholderiales bacterium]
MASTEVRTSEALTREEKKILSAASLGTIFEWYDFFLFGALAPVMAKQFFAKTDPTTGLILALLAFSAGFIVRPLGALVFGRLGDLVGRKYTFLATILLMGIATFLVGLLPNYESWGVAAPIVLIGLRLLQGLAVGGEYGGAAVYVAEHARPKRRGEFTAWIQTNGSLGLLLSLLVILGCRSSLGEEAFAQWGWRIPYLLSIVLLVISVWIRLSMEESPAFARLKAQGKTSKAPISEAFGRWKNLRLALIAVFGLIGAFATLWYTSQFYALLFLTQTLKADPVTANLMVCVAITLATPFYVIAGVVSDRIGRKKVMIAGMLLGAATLFPIFKALTHYTNPALENALANAPVVLVTDPAACHVQFNLTGTTKFTSSCDIAKAKLAAASVNYSQEVGAPGSVALVKVGSVEVRSFEATGLPKEAASALEKTFVAALSDAIRAAGYPLKADPATVNKPMIVLLVFLMTVFAAMVYGPAAAVLVELFPTRIRYTALSLPYHLGAGWIGGSMPPSAFALVSYRGDIYFGLWYPVTILLIAVVVGTIFLPETKDVDIHADD